NKLTGNRRGLRLVPADHQQPDNSSFERHSLIQKSRRLLLQGSLYGAVAVLSLVVLFIVAKHFGSIWVLAGFLLGMPTLMFFHRRSNVKYLTNVVRTTPCPRCGKLPMDYV